MARSETTIIEEILNVDCALSPENLSCDGEASASYIKKRRAELNKERAKLVRELGREPSHDELWPQLTAR